MTVPVLSRTAQSILPSSSSASALLKRMPRRAPRPVPTMMAVGVARPSAQGQEMTRTEMAHVSAKEKSRPRKSHTTSVRSAMPITTGTKTPLTRSARRAIGAFDDVASSTSLMICASAVSSPTRSAFMTNRPLETKVAPVSASPGFFSTGMLSPVMADSSTEPEPSVTMPSTGMDAPVFSTTRSPAATASRATVTSLPSRSTTAVLGARAASFSIASVVRPLARASSHLPTVMSVTIMAAPSK